MENGNPREETRALALSTAVASVEKLEAMGGAWFLDWEVSCARILVRAGLWDVVDPDQNLDSHRVSSDVGVSIEERKREAWDIIQSTVAFEIECNRDPRECWIYLQNRFAPKTAVRRYEFSRRLWNLRMRDDENALEFRLRVHYVLAHLNHLGVYFDEMQLILILIDALPQNWQLHALAFRQEAEFGTALQTTEELFRRMILVESNYETRAEARAPGT